MTKNEIKQAITDAGFTFRTGLNKDELMDIYNRLPQLIEERDGSVDEPTNVEYSTEEYSEEQSTEVNEEQPSGDDTGQPSATDFDDLLGRIETAKAPEPPLEPQDKPLIEATRRKKKKGESSPDSFRVEGYILLLITDTAFPFLLVFLNNLFDKKGRRLRPEELQLNADDFKKLEPLADQAADYMAVNLNPVAGFFIVSAFMYANNFIAIKMNVVDVADKKEA